MSIYYAWIQLNASKPHLPVFVLKLSLSFKFQIVSAAVFTASLTLTTGTLPRSNGYFVAHHESLCRSTNEYSSDVNLSEHNV